MISTRLPVSLPRKGWWGGRVGGDGGLTGSFFFSLRRKPLCLSVEKRNAVQIVIYCAGYAHVDDHLETSFGMLLRLGCSGPRLLESSILSSPVRSFNFTIIPLVLLKQLANIIRTHSRNLLQPVYFARCAKRSASCVITSEASF